MLPCKPDHNGECLVCDCWLADCPFMKKPGKVPAEILERIDPKYFKDAEDMTVEKACYRLATWLYDKEYVEPLLPKLKEYVPMLYVQVLENFVIGNHDT